MKNKEYVKSNDSAFQDVWVMDIEAILNNQLVRSERVPMNDVSLKSISLAMEQGPIEPNVDMDDIKLAIKKHGSAKMTFDSVSGLEIRWSIKMIPFAKKFFKAFG